MEEVKKFFIKEASGTKILVAQTENNEYFFKDGYQWSISAFPIADCPEINMSNPKCKSKCEDVYQRESGILKCKNCGKVFY